MMQQDGGAATELVTPPSKLREFASFFPKKGPYSQLKDDPTTLEGNISEDTAHAAHNTVVMKAEFDVEVEKEDTLNRYRDRGGIRGRLAHAWKTHTVIIAWGIGICGLLCCAWIGPCFKYLGALGVTPTRRASWRSQALIALLVAPACLEYRTLTHSQKRDLFSLRALRGVMVCGVLWLGDLSFWSNALEYTTVPRASIFANSHSLLMILYFKIFKMPVSGLEIVGTVVGFSGLITAVLGTQYFGGGDTATSDKVWLGDLLSFGTAVSTLGYILNAGPTRKLIPVFTYTLTNTIFLAIGLSVISIFTEHTTFDTSVHGLFGWLQPRYMVVVGTLSVVAGVLGFNFNSFAVKYVPPIAYAIIGLCDPVVSGTFAWLVGVDKVPGIFTFLGGGITIGGTIILLIGQDRRTKKERRMVVTNTEGEDTSGVYTLGVSESAFSIEDENTVDGASTITHTSRTTQGEEGEEGECEEGRSEKAGLIGGSNTNSSGVLGAA